MIPELSQELAAALDAQSDDRLDVMNPANSRVYFIVDADTLRHLEQEDTHTSIARGVASAQRGEGRPLDEVAEDIRRDFGFPEPK